VPCAPYVQSPVLSWFQPCTLEARRSVLAEALVEYPDVIIDDDGKRYIARAVGAQVAGHSWHGWIEFESMDDGAVIRSGRETTQPNLKDAVYWATGITPVYLEGALRRALHPRTRHEPPPLRAPVFDEPAPDAVPAPPAIDAVLDPFAVYAKSEELLLRQLTALSGWHLVNIVRAYAIRTDLDPNRMSPSELIAAILVAARSQAGKPIGE
jgi:hypothetical protein